jgi:hypothetical protein
LLRKRIGAQVAPHEFYNRRERLSISPGIAERIFQILSGERQNTAICRGPRAIS